MKEKDSFILDIKRLGINGEGIGFYNRMAVFVPNAIPGEGHQVEVVKVDHNMAFANTIQIMHASKERTTPTCPYYSECGGCNVSHISYNKMLDLKREAIIEAITRYTSLNPRAFEIKKTIPSFDPFHYRNRSQLAIKSVDGKHHICMLKPNSNTAVPIEECLVQKEKMNELSQKIVELAEQMNISCYISKFGRGILRYLMIRVNEKDEALVCLICGEKSSRIRELAKKVIELSGVVGVYESFNDSKKESSFFGTEPELLEGKPFLLEQLGHVTYRIYPNTFFLLNTKQAKNMLDVVLKACKLSRKERVLDAYSGVGTIGLYLAHMAKEVVGIEYNKEAVIAANENAELNRIRNAKFLQGNAAVLLPQLLEKESFDVLVVEPPRTGLEESFIQAVLHSKIKRMIYVSSNPATLAKDLEILSKGYQVNSITPLDMFPQSMVIESITTLFWTGAKTKN